MKLPSYLEISPRHTPFGWQSAQFHIAFRRCDWCGAKNAALSNPCGFDHLDKVLQFSSDMRHTYGMTLEELKALKTHYDRSTNQSKEIDEDFCR